MRLIDADALKAEIDNSWTPDIMVREIWEIIDRMPSFTQKSIDKARWIEVYGGIYKCTNCKSLICCSASYCPDCGAKMENGK